MNFSWPSILLYAGFASSLVAMSGCDQLPGKPKESDRWQPPEANKDFKALYATNCSACHGNEGDVIGPSISVLDPFYVAVVPRDVLKKVIAEGLPGTSMSGFAQSSGGELTDEQVEILVKGIEAKGSTQNEGNPPPYSAPLGDAGRGAEVYNQYCAGCHGQLGEGGKDGGSVVEPDYLHLVSDQYLRSVVIAGRPELGMPDYRKRPKSPPMSSEQVSDVVAWLVSHRHPSEQAQAGPSPTPSEKAQASPSSTPSEEAQANPSPTPSEQAQASPSPIPSEQAQGSPSPIPSEQAQGSPSPTPSEQAQGSPSPIPNGTPQ